jgi:ATP phosphoribosyltransferase regulatory subunit HisZ
VIPQLGGVPGFRDLLPEEAEVLREAQESLLGEMRRWGYRYIITPMVESTQVLELGLGPEQRRRLFKFADVRGEVVALVGERTVPVARVVAGKLRSAPLSPSPLAGEAVWGLGASKLAISAFAATQASA